MRRIHIEARRGTRADRQRFLQSAHFAGRSNELPGRLIALSQADAVADGQVVANPLDAGHALDDPQRFFPLQLIGHRAGQLGGSILEDHMNVVMPELSVLPEVVGNRVGHLLVGGHLLGRRQDLALLDAQLARFIGRHGVRQPQPQRADQQISNSEFHGRPPPESETRIEN